MFHRWAWRPMAACVRLKYSASKAAAKVNKSRALHRPPSNASLRNSCFHLAAETTDIPPSECIRDMRDSNQHTHSFSAVTMLQFLPHANVNRSGERADQAEVMTSLRRSLVLCAVIGSSLRLSEWLLAVFVRT